jgi:hypothetical protein
MEDTNLIRKLKNLLRPLDRGLTDEIVTRPLNSKSRRQLYNLCGERGYLHEKVEASTGSKRKLACICGTPYSSRDVDWDAFNIEPHCQNMSCSEYGYMSNQVATLDISEAKRELIARLESVDIAMYTVRVWKPQ